MFVDKLESSRLRFYIDVDKIFVALWCIKFTDVNEKDRREKVIGQAGGEWFS